MGASLEELTPEYDTTHVYATLTCSRYFTKNSLGFELGVHVFIFIRSSVVQNKYSC